MTTLFKDYQISPHADATLTRFVEQRGVSRNFVNGRYEHCLERFQERFNSTISYQDWESINFAIFSDDADITEYVDSGTKPGTSLYIVKFQNKTMLVAYSDSTFCMMTILPKSDDRLLAYNQRRFQHSSLSDFANRHVEARQEAAASFQAATGKPFAEALSKVEIVPPSPTVAETVTDAVTSDDEPVASLFSKLDEAINDRLDADGAATAEIEALEARLTALREEAKLSDLSRRMLSGAREMGGATFEQFTANLITAQDARQTVALLLARVSRPSAVAPTIAPAPTVAEKIEAVPVASPTPSGRTYRKSKNSTPKGSARQKRDAAILERFEQGFVGREIAEEFGIAAQTCYVIKHRAKAESLKKGS